MPTTTDRRRIWGEQLRVARVLRRDSQNDVATQVELTPTTVHRAENGRGSIEVYDRLASHLGVTLTLGAPEPEGVAS